MLEFTKIMPQIGAMGQETLQHRLRQTQQALAALRQARLDATAWQRHAARINAAETKWLTARMLGDTPVSDATPLPPVPAIYTALATDGSQIPLDRHALAPCFVLNVGEIALHYGTGERPRLTSDTALFYEEKDVLIEGEDGEASFVTEREIAALRFSAEADRLQELIDDNRDRDQAIALMDGTLILWQAEPDPQQQALIARLRTLLTAGREAGIPIASYLSAPGSRDVVNALRVSLCPDETVICKRCAHDPKALPCAPINRVNDALLFQQILQPGERSQMFASRAQVLRHYAPDTNKIAFFYLNAGPEIARVEVPLWVAQDAVLVDRVHALVYDQAQKGQGYPVSLMEAHERAVVRGPERDAFFRMVERVFAQQEITAHITRKALSKRTRIL